jgi:hypothetical protein
MSLETAIQNLAEAINRYCETISQPTSQGITVKEVPKTVVTGSIEEKETTKPQPKKRAKKVAPKKSLDTEAELSLPEVSIGDLRKIGTTMVNEGLKDEFIEELQVVGASNVTTVPDDKRGELLSKLEVILGKTLNEIED